MTVEQRESRGPVLLWVQHLLGSGHLRRAAALARGMARHGLDVTVISGGMPIRDLDIGQARLVQLPPLRATDASFARLVDQHGRPIDDAWRARRRDALLAAYRALAPRVLLIEMFPFGRRQLRFELLPLLDAAEKAAPRPAILCSVRDVLVAKRNSERLAEMAAMACRYFDRILVHGDPRLVPFAASFPPAGDLGDRLVYTGYVVESTSFPTASEGHEVVVSAGGGAVGLDLLKAALAARAQCRLATAPWRLLVSDLIPEADYSALAGSAALGVTVERVRRDFRALLAASALTISQAGYNTVMDVLGSGARAVLVPFADGGETEQMTRARALQQRGWATLVDPQTLSPATLAAAIDAALDRPPPDPAGLDCSGVETTARIVARCLARGTAAP